MPLEVKNSSWTTVCKNTGALVRKHGLNSVELTKPGHQDESSQVAPCAPTSKPDRQLDFHLVTPRQTSPSGWTDRTVR